VLAHQRFLDLTRSFPVNGLLSPSTLLLRFLGAVVRSFWDFRMQVLRVVVARSFGGGVMRRCMTFMMHRFRVLFGGLRPGEGQRGSEEHCGRYDRQFGSPQRIHPLLLRSAFLASIAARRIS
jgi:hypothetical protein